MKSAKYSMGLLASLLLSLGVSYQVKAHEQNPHTPAETTTVDLTEKQKDKLVEQFLNGLPIPEADQNLMDQQFRDRLGVKDDSKLPNTFVLPEDIKLPSTIPGEWVASAIGDSFQFIITAVPDSKLDQKITNTISTSEYDTPFTAAVTFVPPGGGPPPHHHWWEDEWFWVVQGNLDWYVGERMYEEAAVPGVDAPLENKFHRVQLGTGDLVYSHDKHLHAYNNNTDETTVLIHFWRRLRQTDGGIEQFFLDDELGRLVESPTAALPPNGVIDLELAARFLRKFPEYGGTISSSFDQYLTEDALVEGLEPSILKDNKAEELVVLLRQVPELRQTKSVPEPPATFGFLSFGGLLAITTFKRRNKRIRSGLVNLNQH
jgi:mannose-6-phosphate isomerase-like protein (cupin superfamily)